MNENDSREPAGEARARPAGGAERRAEAQGAEAGGSQGSEEPEWLDRRGRGWSCLSGACVAGITFNVLRHLSILSSFPSLDVDNITCMIHLPRDT